MPKMSKIPDRWIPYKACGDVIEGTRIICFKVPLRKSVQKNNSDIKEIWDIPALLAKIPKLGAVIDLTNTSRYYDPAEFACAKVLYKKILIPGRIIPPENTVKEFFQVIDEFLGKNRDHILGVHCTHGLNRTGYMVCRYMRDRLGIPAKVAIKKFEKARGYQMERENYIADLMGKIPPPPDVGKDTEIKPIVKPTKSFAYRSPLQEEEDNYYYSQSYTRGRNCHRNSRERMSRGKRHQSKSNERDRSRTRESDRKRPYDYRYDY